MLELLLTLALAPAPLPLTPAPTPTAAQTVEEVEAARAALETAFKQGKPEDQVAAIASYGRIADAKIVDWLAKGLKESDPTVRDAALDALRWTEHPDALKDLESFAKREKKALEDPEFGPNLIRAIAQHGNVKSVDLLSKDALSDKNSKLVEARILGLGNIRDPKSVEALMSLMKKAGRAKTQPYMGEFRMSLMVLTGADVGTSQDAWIAWWNDNKKTLEVAPTAPELPKAMQRKWNRYWDIEWKEDRGKRREDRGGDEG